MSTGSVVAVAVCPHPPLLVPEIAAGAAAELDGLRAACDDAVRRMLAAETELVAVVGSAPDDDWYPSADHGNLRRFGGPSRHVNLGIRACNGVDELPLAITIGAWLLHRAATPVVRRGRGVPGDAPTTRCLDVGAGIARSPQRVGLLVMGDGSARRTDRAPGHFHPDAESFDATVAGALATADTEALVKLDPGVAAELMVAGRAPYQVLAGACAGREWRSELLYDAAPYGVGYFVASWS